MKSKSNKQFPDPKRLAEVRKRLSSSDVIGSSLLPENASQIDRTKFKACEMIIKYRRKSGLQQKELAKRLGVDESRMSEILRYKVENFTLDRLVAYAQVLYPNLKLELDAA